MVVKAGRGRWWAGLICRQGSGSHWKYWVITHWDSIIFPNPDPYHEVFFVLSNVKTAKGDRDRMGYKQNTSGIAKRVQGMCPALGDLPRGDDAQKSQWL